MLTFVRVVVSLLDQGQFFSLVLIQAALDTVGFFKLFESQNQQLSIVL